MLQLHNLRPNAGARKDAKRVARGLNNGSGVGNAGQNSRSGPSYVRGFEGGRTPVWKRIPQLPEFVVSLQNMKKPAILQLDMLQRLFDIGKLKRPLVTPQDLYAAGVKGMEHGLVLVGKVLPRLINCTSGPRIFPPRKRQSHSIATRRGKHCQHRKTWRLRTMRVLHPKRLAQTDTARFLRCTQMLSLDATEHVGREMPLLEGGEARLFEPGGSRAGLP